MGDREDSLFSIFITHFLCHTLSTVETSEEISRNTLHRRVSILNNYREYFLSRVVYYR